MRPIAIVVIACIFCDAASTTSAQEPPQTVSPFVGNDLRTALAGKRLIPVQNQAWLEFGQEFCRDGRWNGAHDRDNTTGTYELKRDVFCVDEQGEPHRCYRLFPTKDGVRLNIVSGKPEGISGGDDGFFRVEKASC